MVSRKALKITGAAIAVTAIAIGLGIGLAPKKNETTKQLSASQASGWNMYCGRRLDGTGRYLSAPTKTVRGEERKLGKEFIDCSGTSKGSKGSITDLCGPSMIEVPCACPVAPTPSFSKGASKGTTGGGGNLAPTPSGWGSDGHRSLQWGSDGHSNVFKPSGGSKSGGSNLKPSGGSKGGSKSSGGSNFKPSGGSKGSFTSKSSGSKSSYIYYSGSKSGGSKGSITINSKGSYFSKGSTSCTCLVPANNYSGSKGSKGSVSGGQCTCLAPASSSKSKGSYFNFSGSKGSKGSGLVPVTCPCSEPIPVAPSLCEPTPVPSPVPTTCGQQVFFFYQGTCTNEVFIADVYSYANVETCCNINFGIGSYGNGGCSFVDTCNPSPTPRPTPKPTPKPSNKPITAVTSPAPTPMPSPEPTPSPQTPAPTPCSEQIFFYNGVECSNEFYIADALGYDSLGECCNAKFGFGSAMTGGCVYTDICSTEPPTPSPVTDEPTPNPTPSPVTDEPTPSPVTPTPTPCEAQVFFYDGSICSNEFYIADTSSYSSLIACCNANFGSGSFMNGNCDYTDVCSTEPPSPSPIEPVETPVPSPSPVTPAPTPCEAQLFFYDGVSCSNEFIIADASSYDTLTACCSANFGSMSLMTGDCEYTDVCNTLPPSSAPFVTNPPTSGSTPTVSTEVTGPPTLPNRPDNRGSPQDAWFTVVGNP